MNVISKIIRDENGAATIEFAIVLVPFLLMLIGTLDIAYGLYLRTVAEGVLQNASRQATVGGVTKAQIDAFIQQQMVTIKSKDASVNVNITAYHQFSQIGRPEPIVSDTTPLGVYNVGDCYTDWNGNDTYDVSGGQNLGGADDVVLYTVSVTGPRLFPVPKLFGWSNSQNATVKAVIKNQPYADQKQEKRRCQ